MNIDKMLAFRRVLQNTLFDLNAEILKELTLWQSKADHGFKVDAILQLRDEIIASGGNCTLAEAKRMVDAHIASNRI